jgi:hypothetical protein
MLLASQQRLFSVGSFFSGQVAVRVVPIDRLFPYRPRVSVGPDCVERPVKQVLGPLVRRSVHFGERGQPARWEGSDPLKHA